MLGENGGVSVTAGSVVPGEATTLSARSDRADAPESPKAAASCEGPRAPGELVHAKAVEAKANQAHLRPRTVTGETFASAPLEMRKGWHSPTRAWACQGEERRLCQAVGAVPRASRRWTICHGRDL